MGRPPTGDFGNHRIRQKVLAATVSDTIRSAAGVLPGLLETAVPVTFRRGSQSDDSEDSLPRTLRRDSVSVLLAKDALQDTLRHSAEPDVH